MIKVGNVGAKIGTMQKGVFRVGSYADGTPIAMPVVIAAGEQEGPTLWLEGCVHGEEYGGAASIVKFMQALDLKKLKGTLIALPVANIPSYLARGRNSGMDGENLNRLFPGKMNSTYSHQLAYKLLEAITANADYVLDLHSGGNIGLVPFYAIYSDDNSETAKMSKRMAKSLGVEVIWRVKEDGGMASTLATHTTAKGIPSVTVECGGGSVSDENIANYLSAITNAMRAIGMLEGDVPKLDRYTIVSDGSFLFNQEGGLFEPDCEVGAFLRKNEPIGHIINLYGEKVDETLNPYDYAFVAATLHKYVPTNPGELIAEAVAFEKYETFEE